MRTEKEILGELERIGWWQADAEYLNSKKRTDLSEKVESYGFTKALHWVLGTNYQRLYEMNELAARFYQNQLGLNEKAQQYLLEHGISEESATLWRLGYSPDEWQRVNDFLISEGFTRDEIISTGLAVRNEKGRSYDRFRGRVMFPIFSFNSKVIGFWGRLLSSKEGSLLVTPNTSLISFDRSDSVRPLSAELKEIRFLPDENKIPF